MIETPQANITPEEEKAIIKIRQILNRGRSAEVKRRMDGGLTVYEVRKEKR